MDTLVINKIPLTQGKFAFVDDEDFEWLSQWKWHYSTRYAARSVHLGVFNGVQKRKRVFMHKAILEKYLGTKELQETDHINCDSLDNRKCNLRLATRKQNGSNRRIPKSNTSGYKGVSWDKTTTNRDKKWLARIKVNNRLINLGRYLTKEEAAQVYNQAASQYFGEFSNLNQIGGI